MKRIFALIFIFAIISCSLASCGEDPMVKVAKGFEVDNEGLTMYKSVSAGVDTLDMSAIEVTEDYEWSIFSDTECKNEIAKNKVALGTGNNVFYLVIFDDDEEVLRYTVTVRRSEGIKIEESNGGLTGSIDIGELVE